MGVLDDVCDPGAQSLDTDCDGLQETGNVNFDTPLESFLSLGVLMSTANYSNLATPTNPRNYFRPRASAVKIKRQNHSLDAEHGVLEAAARRRCHRQSRTCSSVGAIGGERRAQDAQRYAQSGTANVNTSFIISGDRSRLRRTRSNSPYFWVNTADAFADDACHNGRSCRDQHHRRRQ